MTELFTNIAELIGVVASTMIVWLPITGCALLLYVLEILYASLIAPKIDRSRIERIFNENLPGRSITRIESYRKWYQRKCQYTIHYTNNLGNAKQIHARSSLLGGLSLIGRLK